MRVICMKNRIKQLRKEQHMTQIRLSIELEISQETVSCYESGKYYPSFPVLLKLSRILNTSIDYMMGLSDVRHPQLSALSPHDEAVLSLYTVLDPHQQEKAVAYMQGLLDH